MICLTGDIHHSSLNTREKPYIIPYIEAEVANKYMRIASKYSLKVTFFITGRTFWEEIEDVKKLLQYKNLEIGGHTFNAFKPLWLHRTFKLIRGSYWRSKRQQKLEIKQTVEIIKSKTGISIQSWRNHSYEYDRNTPRLLEKFSIKVWSDVVDRQCNHPYQVANNLVVLPLNIIGDHSYLYHGYITEEYVKKNATGWAQRIINQVKRCSPNSRYYQSSEWVDIVKKEVQEKIEVGGVAILNLHPACMYLLDNFSTFENLCKFFSNYESIWAKEAFHLVRDTSKINPIAGI